MYMPKALLGSWLNYAFEFICFYAEKWESFRNWKFHGYKFGSKNLSFIPFVLFILEEEKDVKAPNIIERDKEEIEAISHTE